MINLAIIGTGAISDSHIQAALQFPDRCRIAALVDLYPDKARQKAAQFNLDLPVHPNLESLLPAVDFDAACVCLPPFEHAPATLALLQAGRHVLVEKPMATSLAECDAMLHAATTHHRVLSVVAQNRFKNPVAKLKKILESGIAGRVLHAQVDSLWWRGSAYYDLWWRGTWAKEGGGCTMNHAVHHLDLYLWLMGVPQSVQAAMTNLNHPNSEVEDFAAAVLTHPDGRIGQITASLVHHGESQQLVFQTERARLAVPWQVQAMRQLENGFPEHNPQAETEIQSLHNSLPNLPHEGHTAQLANFLDAIAQRAALLIDGIQGRQTLELITAIYQSAHQRAPVSLPLPASSPFYTREEILKHARHFHEKTRSVDHFATNTITLGRNLNA
jgi:UDP-N-acetyl-2-amino-2-deoxyglucuronate dehydrogenase